MEPAKRKVVQRSPAHTVRLLHLPQLQEEPVEADSALERDFVLIASLFPHIRRIQHQPFRLTWSDRSYTPDFLLTFADGTRVVIEVKPQSKTERYDDLFKLAQQKLAEHGLTFLVATDQVIHAERAANAKLIRRYSKLGPQTSALERVLHLVGNGGVIADICGPDDLPLLRHLICQHRMATDPSLDTAPTGRVFPVQHIEGEDHALQFSSWLDS
ncbi:TnsA endonuclease N-terminal domain-containing protein [Leptospira sp. 96542]|nr:TnsA endonuclease N-terminal domain-containing protein [Leptospira sp. 96542]